MNKTILISILVGMMPLTMMAQDDDLYFKPEKVSKVAGSSVNKTHENAYYIGSNRDVDEYNRRGNFNSSYQKIDNDVIDFNGIKGMYPDSSYVDTMFVFQNNDDDYIYSRRMGRFDGFYDPWFYGYYGYSPFWYSRWGWYDPWYSGYYGYAGYYGWFDPWYYGWGSPYYYGGWYGYYPSRYHGYYGGTVHRPIGSYGSRGHQYLAGTNNGVRFYGNGSSKPSYDKNNKSGWGSNSSQFGRGTSSSSNSSRGYTYSRSSSNSSSFGHSTPSTSSSRPSGGFSGGGHSGGGSASGGHFGGRR